MKIRMRSVLVLPLAIVALLGSVVHGDSVDLGIEPLHEKYLGCHVADWSRRIASSDRALRRRSLKQLLDGGRDATPVLARLLESKIERVRKHAAATLSRLGPDVMPHVAKRLSNRNERTRFHAMTVFRNLGRDAGPAAARIARHLTDDDPAVSMEAGRTLALMGDAAALATPRLARVLTHEYRYTKVMSAAALAAIGPRAAAAVPRLIVALKDKHPAVRRSAAEALGAICSTSHRVIAALARALEDPDAHVRLCAAGALGKFGPRAKSCVSLLESKLSDPSLATEVIWALEQITGERRERRETPGRTPARSTSSARRTVVGTPRESVSMLGRTAHRNNATETSVPVQFSPRTKENLRWSVRLGHTTYGAPIVAGENVYVGTDNRRPRQSGVRGERGVLMAFRERDGKFLWQDATPRRLSSFDGLLLPVTSSSPLVEGSRLYYVNGQAQLRCLDTEGFRDGENDGPYRDESRRSKKDADLIWQLDMYTELGVFPHEAANCSVATAGNLLLVCTSNGVDEAHSRIPAPRAPSFLGVDKTTGNVVWQVAGPSPRVFHGQWSSPAVLETKGRTLALFGGGDGVLYALEASTGREIWRFDGNPKDAVWRPSGDRREVTLRNNIIACPVVHRGIVYLAMGQDPEHGQGMGRLFAIDPGGQGDVTHARKIWENAAVGRMIATPVIRDELLFVGDYNGYVHCVDTRDGQTIWSHDLLAGIWGSLVLAGDHVYVGDEDGTLTVFEASREKRLVHSVDMDSPLWAVLTAQEGTLYVASARGLFAFGRRR
ncbi:MAG: PQQ-binding-like beta-propeller repeat protein [Planctomycetota bacterium]